MPCEPVTRASANECAAIFDAGIISYQRPLFTITNDELQKSFIDIASQQRIVEVF